jgi:hypothetical protein
MTAQKNMRAQVTFFMFDSRQIHLPEVYPIEDHFWGKNFPVRHNRAANTLLRAQPRSFMRLCIPPFLHRCAKAQLVNRCCLIMADVSSTAGDLHVLVVQILGSIIQRYDPLRRPARFIWHAEG